MNIVVMENSVLIGTGGWSWGSYWSNTGWSLGLLNHNRLNDNWDWLRGWLWSWLWGWGRLNDWSDSGHDHHWWWRWWWWSNNCSWRAVLWWLLARELYEVLGHGRQT
jgi:hypothetical protein